jgi:uncharacterized protein with HEPN domain
MKKAKDNLVYVKHIRDAIEKIYEYTLHHTLDDLKTNEWDQAAIMRYFEIIGEAVTRIEPSFKETNSSIEWRDMSDFRNFLIHDYIDVDVNIVWDTMKKNIPILKEKIEQLLVGQ